ncbi:MAG: purine-nucleoside phosphorylase [Gemmatimonadaceae bacterium]
MTTRHASGPRAPSPTGPAAAASCAEVLRTAMRGASPSIGLVLGSGLGGLTDRVEDPHGVRFAEIPGFPRTAVAGHPGMVVGGRLVGREVVVVAGRFHIYEGHDVAVAGFPVRVLHALGVRTLIVSNAAGGIRRTLRPGDLMVIADHANLMFRNPLIGILEGGDERFPDMSTPYDGELRRLLHVAGGATQVALTDGVYAALAGPSYETPAEVRMLERLGADAVGMSTVPEVLVARALGMRVVGISCITNLASGLARHPLTHSDVLETSARVAADFERLVMEFVGRI